LINSSDGTLSLSFIFTVIPEYSLLDGANKVDKLFERIKALKQPAVAMTDHGNMFGASSFIAKR